MTNEELIAKIKAEIERRIKEYDAIIESQPESNRAERDAWKWAECKSLLSFLNSLQVEEFPAGLDEKPRKRLRKVCNWIEEAKYEIEHQEELLEERLQELHKIRAEKNLDGAAEEQARSFGYMSEDYEYKENVESFKAGAEWAFGQGYTKEETVYFERLCDENRIMVNLGWGEPERGGFNPGDKVVVQIRKK